MLNLYKYALKIWDPHAQFLVLLVFGTSIFQSSPIPMTPLETRMENIPISQAGLEKIPISPWSVTQLHICGVIPTPQSQILPETARELQCCRSEHRCCAPSADVSALSANIVASNGECSIVSWFSMIFHNVLKVLGCFISGSRCFMCVSRCFRIFYDSFLMFYYVYQCFTMFSESRNNRHRRIGDRAAADHLRDRKNPAGIGDNAAKVIPC